MIQKIKLCVLSTVMGAAVASSAMAGGSATANGPTAPIVPVATGGQGTGGGGTPGGPAGATFIQLLTLTYSQ